MVEISIEVESSLIDMYNWGLSINEEKQDEVNRWSKECWMM